MSSRGWPNSSSASAFAKTIFRERSAATVASGRPSSTARSAVGARDSPSPSTRAQPRTNQSVTAMGLAPHRVPAQPVVVTPPTPAGLLRVEHAVAAALVEDAPLEDVLAAIGGGLGWHYGGAWLPQAGAVRCVATWSTANVAAFAAASKRLVLGFGEGLPGRVQDTAERAWIADVEANANFPRHSLAIEAGLRSAFAFPLAGGGTFEFLTTAALKPDTDLLATLTSLGRRIGDWM